MTHIHAAHASLDELRDQLADLVRTQPLWTLRGERGGFIRADGSAWGESLGATHCLDFDHAWLRAALEPGGLEPIDPRGAEASEESGFWPRLPSLLPWMQGAIHPEEALEGLATALRRASISPCMDHRRIRLGHYDLTVPCADYQILLTDPRQLAAAFDNPARLDARARLSMSSHWHEAIFSESIDFVQSSLPSIKSGSPILARRLDAGSWLLEHPDEPSWLCKLPAPGISPASSSFSHDGLDIHEFSQSPQDDSIRNDY